MKRNAVVVGLGEVLWDVFPDRKRLGGAPANFAYHMSRQACDTYIVSAVGEDADGSEIEKKFERKGLSTKYLSRVPVPTGRVDIAVDASGVASYRFLENCAWDYLAFSEEAEKLACRTDAVCFGTLAQRSARSRDAIYAFLNCIPESAIRVFDVNLRQNFFSEEIVVGSLARASVLKVNEDEWRIVGGFCRAEISTPEIFFAAIFRRFPNLKIIVLTSGKSGSEVATRDGLRSRVFSDSSIEIVDTVGAGDAFTAGFISALLRGASVEKAHSHAARLAGFVCSRAGAMPDVPADYCRLEA